MRAGFDIANDNLFEIPAWNAFVVKENIVIMFCKIVINSQRPGYVCAAITYKDCFLRAWHSQIQKISLRGGGIKYLIVDKKIIHKKDPIGMNILLVDCLRIQNMP
jgi:hypothetical protein